MYDLDPDHEAIVAAYPALNQNLRRDFGHFARPNSPMGMIENALVVGALCDRPGQLSTEDRHSMDIALGDLSAEYGIGLHPDVNFRLCNLIYGQNFFDPEYQRNHPADYIIFAFIYNPDLRERLALESGQRTHETRYKQIDLQRHFQGNAWSDAAKGFGARILSVIHWENSEVGPDRFDDGFWIARENMPDPFVHLRHTILFKDGFSGPTY